MRVQLDHAYGVVPLFRDGKQWFVLLVHQVSYRGDNFWIFPKGHQEGEETPHAAALRELEEETGITEVHLPESEPLVVTYSFVHNAVRIEKTVTYFIGLCTSQKAYISQPQEIKELRWCSVDEAAMLLTHQNSRDVLGEVKRVLEDLFPNDL